MTSLRECVAQQMVRIHWVRPDLAAAWVGEMDEEELHDRFRKYTEMELSVARRNPKSVPDFYQVFGSATATARIAALNPVSAGDSSTEDRKSLPELDEKTWSSGGVGR